MNNCKHYFNWLWHWNWKATVFITIQWVTGSEQRKEHWLPYVKNEDEVDEARSQIRAYNENMISEAKPTSVDKYVVTTVHKQEVISWYAVRPYNSSNCDDLGCISSSFIDCKRFFYTDERVSQFLCHSRASCLTLDSRACDVQDWLHESVLAFTRSHVHPFTRS